VALVVVRSNRSEALAEALCDVLREAPADPLAPEWVVVPSRGVERWVGWRVASALGVCAGVAFPFPARFFSVALSAAVGVVVGDAWAPERLRWLILSLLPTLMPLAAFAPLRAWVGDAPGRPFELANRIARTFDRYITWRPDVLAAWTRGEGGDWQALLWRRLRQEIAEPHIADLVAKAETSRARGPIAGVPGRVFLFGFAALPPLHVAALHALGRRIDVHVLVASPCREWWAHTRSRAEIARSRVRTAGQLELHHEQGHTLLASLGRLGREFQAVLEASGDFDEPGDRYEDPEDGPDGGSVLAGLQADMLDLRRRGPGGLPPRVWRDGDRSVSLHACRGAMRQVEVLRDRLIELVQARPASGAPILPRDIVVLTPDVERFAPLIDAVFSATSAALPYRIADRVARRANPVVEVLFRVFDLVEGRFTAPEVHDVLGLEPVAARFGLTSDDLDRVAAWIRDAGVRFAIDGGHRAELDLPADHAGTWLSGLRRVLLGVVLGARRPVVGGSASFCGVVPLPAGDADSGRLVGRFVDAVAALSAIERGWRAPRPIVAWCDAVTAALNALVVPEPGGHRMSSELDEHVGQVRRALAGLVEEAAGSASGSADPVPRSVIRTCLEERLGAASGSAGFVTGAVTVCGMVPMRAIPFRVVALLGMDDGVFPRSVVLPGFDLSSSASGGSASRRLGDRSPRDDDRFLFLEALLAARDHLLVFWTGKSDRNDEHLAPAVPVGELIDVLDEGWRFEDGSSVRERIVVEHPLQPFAPRAFSGVVGRTSWDPEWLGAARALAERSGAGGVAAPIGLGLDVASEGAEPLPDDVEGVREILLSDLFRFIRGPTRFLVEHRLRVDLSDDVVLLEDRDATRLDGLEDWRAGDRLLEERVGGAPPDAEALLRGLGWLPPGAPGAVVADDIASVAGKIALAADRRRGGAALDPIEVVLPIRFEAGEVCLVGRLADLYPGGLVRVTYGRLRAADGLELWARHLVAGAFAGVESAFAIGRPAEGGEVAELHSRRQDSLREDLKWLVRMYVYAWRRVLPLFPETSRAWWRASRRGGPDAPVKAEAAASRAWQGRGRGEADLERSLGLVFGAGLPFLDPHPHAAAFRRAAQATFERVDRWLGDRW
jgi:exodeoxyribonuclease V gamma subunit